MQNHIFWLHLAANTQDEALREVVKHFPTIPVEAILLVPRKEDLAGWSVYIAYEFAAEIETFYERFSAVQAAIRTILEGRE